MHTLSYTSDYQEGMHPKILQALTDTNLLSTPGYGTDSYSESARSLIRKACDCPNAAVHFLTGGTQTNAVVIDTALAPYQGVIAAQSGHISLHEAGAIEYTGHKVIELAQADGKLQAETIRSFCETFYKDENHEHMVMPGMVYLSQPTEYGTLYSLAELTAIREVCDAYQMKLYLDGARLAYALAAEGNDVTLPDLAKLCDIFYIGGTKCGCLFGEAVVLPDPSLIPHFFTMIKQHGALLAKGRIAGIQFETLFTDDLYTEVGRTALEAASLLRTILKEKNYQLVYENPTNQIFVILDNKKMEELAESVHFGFWEPYDETHTVVRFATSWASKLQDVELLRNIL
ncbi:MAG: beta-eliminating lyase-related protein [Lachnospiraceae bacterium]|nr:beta-eliminating lyase-related protein [Lachnospiraceae bacterium]